MRIRSSLSRFQSVSNLSSDEIICLRKKCYENGIIVIDIESIQDDVIKDGLIEIMDKLYYGGKIGRNNDK